MTVEKGWELVPWWQRQRTFAEWAFVRFLLDGTRGPSVPWFDLNRGQP